MTYLQLKSEGNKEWAEAIQMSNLAGWLTPGRYVRKFSVRALVGKESGIDMSKEVSEALDQITFPDDEGLSEELEEKLRRDRARVRLSRCAVLPAPSIDSDDSEDESERGEGWIREIYMKFIL